MKRGASLAVGRVERNSPIAAASNKRDSRRHGLATTCNMQIRPAPSPDSAAARCDVTHPWQSSRRDHSPLNLVAIIIMATISPQYVSSVDIRLIIRNSFDLFSIDPQK
jgi:hypothetical protein